MAAVVFGGGGSPSPATELILQFLAGAAVLLWFWRPGPLQLPADRTVWVLAALLLIIPALQLVPLPPSLWSSLPGRETEAAALHLVGAEDSWRPLSTSPSRTLASLLSLFPPVFLLLMTASLNTRERYWIVVTIAVMGLVSALLGAVQMAGGPAGPRFYDTMHKTVVTAFQANRNAAADVLLISILAFAAAVALTPDMITRKIRLSNATKFMLAASGLLIVLACVLTASRTGIALLLPTLICAGAIVGIGYRRSLNRVVVAIAGALAALVVAGLLLLQSNAALQAVAARFDPDGEGRPELWRDTLYAIKANWPFGSGMGTFVPTFIASEPLEAVDPSTPNRAHNDFLELALETGFFGLAALVIAISIVIFMAWRGWKSGRLNRSQVLFALGSLLIIAAHSLVDYPLRCMALACLAAVAGGMLAAPPKADASL